MFAIHTMSPNIQGVFFLVAVVLFLLGATKYAQSKHNLMAAGLAVFAFVFMWNAFAAR